MLPKRRHKDRGGGGIKPDVEIPVGVALLPYSTIDDTCDIVVPSVALQTQNLFHYVI